MANMDLDDIIQDLNNSFAAPLPDFYKRRIIFWHDEDREFEDRLDDISLDNAKLLILTDTNNFAAKKLLTVDDTSSNFLVYCPIAYKSEEDNWLLNIELYSEEFRADLLSIWMNEMGIEPNPACRMVVKEYRKFFNAQARRRSFANLAKEISTTGQIHLAVMADICGSSSPQPNAIIRALISGGIDMETNVLYQNLVSYEADDNFWKLVNRVYGYGEENPSIFNMLKHIFLTATTRTLFKDYLAGLDRYISIPHQARCYDFVSECFNAGDKRELADILCLVEEDLMLRDRFDQVPLDDLENSEIFHCINECILKKLMTKISNYVIDVDLIHSMVEKRRTMAWYEDVACYYEGVYQLANMQEFLLDHSEGFHIVEAKNIWKNYTEDYYRMDSYYRQFYIAFDKSLNIYNDHLHDLFHQVKNSAEGIYLHRFLDKLGENWTNVCADDLAEYGRILEVPQQVDFYDQYVRQENSRVFVIISDAFRYELAVSLAQQLRQETQSRVDLSSCAGIFPTVTKFGMAALLPHHKLSVKERSGGDLQVLADGMSTDANNRDKILKAKNPKSVALKYRDLIAMKRTERNQLVKGMEVVYIYHDKMDEAGHIPDSIVFSACDDAIEEIKNMVRIIRNDFGGTRVYITADHGFLYTYSPLPEFAKVDKTSPSENDVEVDRRYLITRRGEEPENLLPVKFMDEDYDAFTPMESVRIKKKGSGLNFVHGGISLQEMVVPVIEYHYLRNDSKAYKRNKDKYDTKPVEIGLLSASKKISNMIFSLNFYQKEAVGPNRSAANYLLYFVDSEGRQVSDTAKIIADKTSDNAQERTFRSTFNLKSLKYDNKEIYYLVIADETGLQMPVKEEFQIDIAFAIDEFDFFS